jgi:hypothetical protein
MASSIVLRSREDFGMESITSILSVASRISYEDMTLIWVDWDADKTADCLHTHDCLRAVVNDVKVFNNAEQSIEYIQWIASEKNIFLIISGLLAESVLSQTHNVPQLESVYIFCLDKEKHASLVNQYAKIRGIFVDKFKLFHQMAEDVLKFDKKAFPLHIFAQKHENGIETSMRDYVTDNKITLNWIELFCFILIYLPLDRKQAKQDMIKQCRMYYHGNEAEQRKIDEFAQRNCTENVIHWYTRDSFVYRLINKALRTLNIDVIFQFRFFIIELYRQLKSYHTNYIKSLLLTPTSATKIRTVYRGQFISTGELEKLKNNVGDIISANSFLSTTEDEMVAKAFIADAPISESALFEINISDSYYDQIGYSLSYTRPFFKAESLSQFSDEKEIIFSMGTIFRIISIEEDSILRIRLELDEHNNSITQHYRHIRKKQRYRHDWQTRSSVDERILLLTEKLPKSYRAIVGLYIQEGMFIDENQPLTIVTESISYYRKGFDLLCRFLPDHFYLLRVIMCLSIGLFYNNLGDTAMSINLGELTLDIVKYYLFADSECLLVCYNYLAVIYKLDNRLHAVFSIYKDMLPIASKRKNTSALLEIYDKLCELSRIFTLREYRLWCQKKMFKCLVRLLMRRIISLSDHNDSFYLNYKTLIKFLQRLVKYKWPCKQKRSLEVLLAKKWPPFRSFEKYIDKLKFMLYFELDNLPRFQSSLHSLLAQAMTEFESRQTYENCFQQVRHDLKRIFKIVPARLEKIDTNAKILRNFLQSINAYEHSLYSMRTTYGLTELAYRNESIALTSILSKMKSVIPDLIRSSRQKLGNNRQRRIFRPRHRSSPMYLNRKTN